MIVMLLFQILLVWKIAYFSQQDFLQNCQLNSDLRSQTK